MSKRKDNSVVGLFWGCSVGNIQKWCRVSKQTAEHYKAGRRHPSARVLQLFKLYSQKKVLGDDWRGWQIINDKLVSPDGKELTHGQLNAYVYIWQLAYSKTNGLEEMEEIKKHLLNNA